MARWFQVLLLALFVFASLQIGECIKCYSCDMPSGQECDDPTKNPDFIKECPNSSDVCFFLNVTIVNKPPQIVRGCSKGDKCPTRSLVETTQCLECPTDLCNSSSNVMPSLFFVGIISIIFANLY